MNCNCTVFYHSVVPPTHCPKCGRCLGCGQGFAPPVYPQQPWTQPFPSVPWPQPSWPVTWPYGSITYTVSSNTTNTL